MHKPNIRFCILTLQGARMAGVICRVARLSSRASALAGFAALRCPV
jgi:hypothetical protein